MDEFLHQSVLLQEAVDALVTDRDGFYIDGTFGRGGHSRLILDRLSEHGKLLVVDKDVEAIEAASSLQEQDERVIVAHRSFADIAEITGMHGAIGQVAGVLLLHRNWMQQSVDSVFPEVDRWTCAWIPVRA